ncbi:hypothetical protein [uncultured Desulfovibrio sp.]|uniref:Uncharacterized protein n=1 Tax=Candidatus Desulfovibrio intestinavium TaxID=2838534 RepID=A0A9D2KS49_9BACT|nr:hypothetical protein [uncultured Desulfovibrio sp.]HJA79545.1 hypothetical protein [Candidatus Desulfovibrio intestinavium]
MSSQPCEEHTEQTHELLQQQNERLKQQNKMLRAGFEALLPVVMTTLPSTKRKTAYEGLGKFRKETGE